MYLSILFYFLLDTNAYAYLDPGTGSIIVQYIIAGLIAASTVFKIYWVKIKDLFTKVYNKVIKKKNNNLDN